jgi:hypothetical protein
LTISLACTALGPRSLTVDLTVHPKQAYARDGISVRTGFAELISWRSIQNKVVQVLK